MVFVEGDSSARRIDKDKFCVFLSILFFPPLPKHEDNHGQLIASRDWWVIVTIKGLVGSFALLHAQEQALQLF